MNRKVLILLLCSCVAIIGLGLTAFKSKAAPQLVVNQLPPLNGTIPVEIVNQKFTETPDHPQGELNYSLKNNSDKSINAIVMSVRWSAIDKGGKEHSSTLYPTISHLIHPDLHNQEPILPGRQIEFQPDWVDLAEGFQRLSKIDLSIDFVIFSDGSSLGPATGGTDRIYAVSKGAQKYKGWLVREFRDGKSVDQLLEKTDFKSEVGIENKFEQLGASLYRKHLQKASHHGENIEKYLK